MPQVIIPFRPVDEARVAASLFRGLAQAVEGKVRPLSWVTEGIDIDEDDDE